MPNCRKAIVVVGAYDWATREYVLGAFQNHLRNQNMFSGSGTSSWTSWLRPFQTTTSIRKSNVIEVGVFPPMGYGPWLSTIEVLRKGAWSGAQNLGRLLTQRVCDERIPPWESKSQKKREGSHGRPCIGRRCALCIIDRPSPSRR